MNNIVPVLPVAGAIVLRACLSPIVFVTRWMKGVARARRNRREAMALAGLDHNILADIGLNRADLNDALSTPFWEDPTLLLRERAIERRLNRASAVRPRINRPPRHAT